jgi:hypothetical protein
LAFVSEATLDFTQASKEYERALALAPGNAEVISLEPGFKDTYAERGLAYYGLGDLESARASCETKPEYWASQQCLAVIYDKLGRHADAAAERFDLRFGGEALPSFTGDFVPTTFMHPAKPKFTTRLHWYRGYADQRPAWARLRSLVSERLRSTRPVP